MKFLPGQQQEVVGIDIGRRFLKAVVLRKGKGGIEVVKAALVRNDSLPEDKSEERIAKTSAALKTVLAELGKKPERIALACPGESLFSRIVKLPPVGKGKLKQIVHYEAQQQIPFSLEEVIWDYHLLAHQGKAELSALILAVKKEIVEEILGLVQSFKLEVEILDFTPLTIYNTLKFNGTIVEERAMVIVDMGARSTDLTIIEGGNIAMMRPIPFGGDNLTQAIAAVLAVDFFEAEKIKEREAAIQGEEKELASERGNKVFEAIKPILGELLDEIRRSIGYYRSQLRGGAIESLVLTGGGIQLKNMERFMEENLRIKVEKFNPFSRVHVSTGAVSRFPEPSVFSVAMGLGLRLLGQGEVRINLLPAHILQRLEFRKKEPVLILSFVLVLLSLLVYAGIIRQLAFREEASLKEVDILLTDYVALDNSLKPKREARGKILDLISQFEKVTKGRTFWLDILTEVTELIPDDITLESFSPLETQAPERSAGVVAGRRDRTREGRSGQETVRSDEGFRLEGLSPSFTTISDFISRLESSPFFSRVEVDPSSGQVVKSGKKEFIKFILKVGIVKK